MTEFQPGCPLRTAPSPPSILDAGGQNDELKLVNWWERHCDRLFATHLLRRGLGCWSARASQPGDQSFQRYPQSAIEFKEDLTDQTEPCFLLYPSGVLEWFFRAPYKPCPVSPCLISSVSAPGQPACSLTGVPRSSRSTHCLRMTPESGRAARAKVPIFRICTSISGR